MTMKRNQKGEIFAVGFAVIWGVQLLLAGVAIVGSIIVVEKNRDVISGAQTVIEQPSEKK
jgi:hypothetical protein